MEAKTPSQAQADSGLGLSRGRVLPYVAVRHAGVSSAGFNRLIFVRTVAMMDECMALEAQCIGHKEQLCAALEEVIGPGQLPQVNRELLGLKRDLFNDRLPKKELGPEGRRVLAERFSSQQADLLEWWLSARRRRDSLMQEVEIAFAGEMAAGRKTLKRLFRNTQFRKGLALASPTLSYELDLYVKAAQDSDVPRIRQTERSLLRYYTRSGFKLSPFSTFTRTKLLCLKERGKARAGRPQSSVKLNRAFIGQIAAYAATHPELRDYVPVTCTGSLTRIGESLLVLRRRSEPGPSQVRLRIPDEAVVMVPSSYPIEWIIAHLEECGGTAS